MSNCRICISPIAKSETHEEYHDQCLTSLLGSTAVSPVLPFTSEGFYQQRTNFSRGMSISGVQEKLSAKIGDNEVQLTNAGGQFILKPTPPEFPELAFNEHISMQLGRLMGIDVPPLGLLRFKDSDQYCYIIRRFDRDLDSNFVLQMEDMMQLTNTRRADQDSKYNSNYGVIGQVIKEASNNKIGPVIDYFNRIIHSFLVGNGDLHMKNISMAKPIDNTTEYYQGLTPLYDVVNSHIYNANEHVFAMDLLPDEVVLSSFENKGFETGADLIQLGEHIGLLSNGSKKLIVRACKSYPKMSALIDMCFLSDDLKAQYQEILLDRFSRLQQL